MNDAARRQTDDYMWRHSVAMLRSLIAFLMASEEKREQVRRIIADALRESVDRAVERE